MCIVSEVVVEAADYCLLESFEPTCAPGSVILMLSAHYGRMRVGRCLSRDYYVGCSADVIAEMDRRCSGKERCTVSVPEPTLLKVTPCPRDLVAYLEADYTCVKGKTSTVHTSAKARLTGALLCYLVLRPQS